jgi:hypothetical protein
MSRGYSQHESSTGGDNLPDVMNSFSGPNRIRRARPIVDNRLKDEALAEIADEANVAQFVSFSPGSEPQQRFARIRGCAPDQTFDSPAAGIATLMAASPERQLNVRSFRAGDTAAQPFIYGLNTINEVVGRMKQLANSGLYTIVNETIDIRDGGVSGVALGGVVEFAPEDTPRCVEKPGTAALGEQVATSILKTVYGFTPRIKFEQARVEFSLHPIRRGWKNEHTIVWEIEHVDQLDLSRQTVWPNRFSEFIGDKLYGLLVANALGFRVPRTNVLSRKVAPFAFGTETGTGEIWLRTCPRVQVPGRYPTFRGWKDPFELMAHEDPHGNVIQSVLAQDSVDALYSGALITRADGTLIIDAVKGFGDKLMQGKQKPEQSIPVEVKIAVAEVYNSLQEILGPVRLEWSYDGKDVWILQLHIGLSKTIGRTIVEGEADHWERFDVEKGLEALRRHLEEPIWGKLGIILVGDVGITSHFADILRRAGVPSRIENKISNA